MNIRLFFLCTTLFIGWGHHLDAQEKSLDERLGEFLQANVYVNNHKILLPCKFTDLEHAGWSSVKDSLSNELAPFQFTSKRAIRLVNKDNQYISVRFYNPYPQPIPIKDCYIFDVRTYDGFEYGIGPEDYYHAPDFEVCGLKSKKATPQDMMNTLGEFLAHWQFEAYQKSDIGSSYKLKYPFYDESVEGDEPNNYLYLSISKIDDYYPGKLIVMHYICAGDLKQKEKYLVPYKVK